MAKQGGGLAPRQFLPPVPEENFSISPLITAALSGDVVTLQNKLEEGADKDEITNLNRTAMWHGASEGHLAIVQVLVEHGANMELVDSPHFSNGCSPLSIACENGHEEVARYLLEQGANRETTDRNGDTPLHVSVENDDLEITQLLMVYGADLNKRNDDDCLPIDYARTEEMRQAIRDEPRRRIDEAPGKRAVEEDQQDQHSNAVASSSSSSSSSSSAHQEEIEVEGEDINNKQPVEVAEGKVAEEDEDSEPSDDEDDRRRRKRAR